MADDESRLDFIKVLFENNITKTLIGNFIKKYGLKCFLKLENETSVENEILSVFCDRGWSFTANAVGDGNFLEFTNQEYLQYPMNKFVIDFGTSFEKQKFLKIKDFRKDSDFLNNFKTLLVSHYHWDHYCGLEYIENNSLNIEQLYYPKIPTFSESDKLEKLVWFINSLDFLSGTPERDLINRIKIKNKPKIKCIVTSLNQKSKPIKFCGEEFEVVWPPEKIENAENSALSKGIKRIEEEIEKDDTLKKLYKDFTIPKISDPIYKDKDDETDEDSNNFSAETKEKIKKLHKDIKRLTNRFSACLYNKEKLLFLGDLENAEIGKCIKYIIKTNIDYRIKPKIFIAPHHGTHWHNELKNVYADYVVMSNGKERIKNFKSEYLGTGKKILSTHINGDIEIRI